MINIKKFSWIAALGLVMAPLLVPIWTRRFMTV